MILKTDRLLIRKFIEEDFDDFCHYAMDDDMCKMMGRDLMTTRDQARLNFNWLKDKEERGYALVDREDGRVIGNLTVTKVPDDLSDLEELKDLRGVSMSFSLGRPHQRKGLMEEAIRSVLDQVFFEEKMDFVHCGHFDFNIASANLQKKLGFNVITRLEFQIEGETYRTHESVLWKQAWL